MSGRRSNRRRFLRDGVIGAGMLVGGVPSLAAGAVVAPRGRRRPPLPRLHGGINVHPIRRLDGVTDFTPPLVISDLVMLQLRAVYELGFGAMRTTLSFNDFGPDFIAAIPYVRATRALGIDVLAVIGQFGHGYDLVQALTDARRRSRVLEAYSRIFAAPVAPATRRVRQPGRLAFQILNEPTEFLGIRPRDYVWEVLAPAATELRRLAPEVSLLAAATVGRRHGIRRLREMLASGAELFCDELALHVYDLDLLDELAPLVRGPLRVTESGAFRVANHRAWFVDGFARIRQALPSATELYWFDLADDERDGFRILTLHEGAGGFSATVESIELEALLRDGVAAAAQADGREFAPFEELMPSLDPYLATEEDLALIEQAR